MHTFMKRGGAASALAIALLLPALPKMTAQAQLATPWNAGKIEWIRDYNAAQQLSLKSGKPLFVVFRCER